MKQIHKGAILVVAVCIALLMVGASGTQNPLNLGFNAGGNDPDDGGVTYGGYPTPTPTRFVPYPTTDPNVFSITQRSTEEYVFDSYTPPTSFKTVANVQEVIVDPDWTGYSHSIGIWGTYVDWRFDVYMKEESDTIWYYQTSGATDGAGSGYADIPLYYAYAGSTFQVIAVIDPNSGGAASDLLDGEFTNVELANMVGTGVIRNSNTLNFDVISTAIL